MPEQSEIELRAGELKFTEAFRIADRQSRFALGRPTAGLVDASGRLYIADAAGLRVVVFSKEGAPLRQFGGRGRGVGHFLRIKTMASLDGGRLAVVDSGRGVLSLWNDAGEVLSERPLGEGMLYTHQVAHLDSEHLVVLEGSGTAGEPNWLLRERERDSLRKTGAMALLGPALARSSGLARGLAFSDPGEFAVSDNVIFYAPRHYEGELYRFYREGAGGWAGPSVVEGCRPGSDAVHAVSFEVAPSDEGPYAYYFRSIGRGGVSELGVAHETVAVVAAKSGEFLHMATLLAHEKRFFVVQRFSRNGSLESVWIERTLTDEMGHSWPRPRVLASDRGGRVAVLKQVDRWLYPEVRVYETGLEW